MKITIIILFVIGFLLTSAFSLNDAFANDGSLIDEINSLEHDTVQGQYNSLVQVDADTYALAYEGSNTNKGFISTFTISADGSTITEVESLEHDTANGQSNSLVHVAGDTYALAYAGADEDADGSDDGYISTFDIDSAGDITPIKVQNHVALGEGSSVNLEHDTANGQYNSLVQVDADTYALAYAGADEDADGSDDGFISTFTISADGSTITEVESLEHDTVQGQYNSLVQVDADTYALAYAGAGDDGFISTFTIDSGGDITPIKVANHAALGEGSSVNLEHDTAKGLFNSLVHVAGDTYALAYAGAGDNGFISTFTIDSGGAITAVKTQSLGNNLEHDTANGKLNSLVQVDADTYALAYTGAGDDGFISTFTISADGSTITEVESLEHDTATGRYNSLVKVDADTYALAYEGDGSDGFISTFTIDGAATDTEKKSSDCYDCKPPKLQQAQIQISSDEKIIATGDDPIHITANVGDKVTILLNVTDNISVDTIPFAALYTNYQEKPSDMSPYYANNFDKWKHVSTSFYEWNVRSDDVPYDYDGTISWSDNTPTVVTGEITEDNFKFKNKDHNTVEYFMIPFTFTINEPMETSQITAKIYDAAGNRLHVTLPVTLEIIPKEIVVLSDDKEIATLAEGDVIVTPSEDTLPLLHEPVLLTVLSQWSGYSQVISDDAEMLSVMGLQGESLPAWTKHLGEWVIQEELDVSELITAINYVHDNQ